MSGSLLEVMMDAERRMNRSCAFVCLGIVFVLLLILLAGFAEVLFISRKWLIFYGLGLIPPIAAVAAYARLRDFRGGEIKHLMVFATSLIPTCMAIPSLFGFFLAVLPIIVAGRYFSQRFVWETYAMVVTLLLVISVFHARYGIPCYALMPETVDEVKAFLDGRLGRLEYWKDLMRWGLLPFLICLGMFAMTMSRLCGDHLDSLKRQAKVNARLADVEKGLLLAAAAHVVFEMKADPLPTVEPEAKRQPDVHDWSTQAIVACMAKCKRRAERDPAFAALVERDPAAAVKEVQE